MVSWITDNCSGSIIRKPAGIPCTDPRYPHSVSVCLMFTAFLDIPFSPQMQFLFLFPGYLSFYIQVLEDNYICMVLFCIFCNCSCNLPVQFYIQAFCISPSALCLYRSMFSLESPYPSQHTVHPVFFTVEVDKLSSKDSSIRPHNGTDCIGIDSQIHTADDLLFGWYFRKYHIFCIRKTQKIFPVPFLQCRGRCLFPGPVLSQILHVGMTQPYMEPLPVMSII